MPVEALLKQKKQGKTNEKYSVDTDSGTIKVASTSDRAALTWDEAEKLSSKITRDSEAKEKKQAKAEKDERESPFTQDAEGNWIINPNARIGGLEILAFEAVRKAQERGEPLDPFEVMMQRAKDVEAVRSIFGGGKEGGGVLSNIEDLMKLKALLGADDNMKALLSGIYKKMSEAGEGKGENEEVRALRDELKELTKKLDEKDRERLDDQITGLRNELTDVRSELAKAASESRAKDEYGIMSQALGVVDKRLGAIENTVQTAFAKPPGALPLGKKRELTTAISEEAKKQKEIDELAEEIFFPT